MTTETISAAELAAEKLDTAPATTSPTPAAAAPTTPAAVTPPAALAAPAGVPGTTPETDALGRPFDAAKFFPKKDSRGRWINRNVGRKPSSAAAAASSGKSYVAPDVHPSNGSATPEAAAPSGPTSDRFDLAAEMYARAGYSVLDGVFSGNGEWLPENDGEHIALRGALATYLRHKQTDDLPPGLALSLALATYSAKRFSKPNTLSRIRMFSYWVRAKIYAWRTGRGLDNLPPPPPAPPAEQRPLPPQNLPAADSSTEVKL